jgi:xylulokinase
MKPGKSAILVMDVGLSRSKVTLFVDGEPVHRAAVSHSTDRPGPALAEQHPDEWLRSLARATRKVLERWNRPQAAIDCVSITGQMHALVCVDSKGEPLSPALVLGDQRAVPHAEALRSAAGEREVYETTGSPIDASLPASRLSWVRRDAPGVWRRTDLLLGAKDYVRSVLTDDRLTDPTDACATGLYDLRRGDWSDTMLKLCGVSRERLPTIRPSASVAGSLRPGAAAELGLAAGTPVSVGAGDDVAVLGAALNNPAHCLEEIGTTATLLAVSPEIRLDPGMTVEVYPHALPGLWVLGGSINAAGSVLSWITRLLGYADVIEAITDSLVGETPLAEDPLFVPHVAGARCPDRSPLSTGAFGSIAVNTNRAALMRASLEGIAFALRAILIRIEELTGSAFTVVSAGAPEATDRWLNLRANVYGRTIVVTPVPDPTARGAMLIGMLAVDANADVDLFPDLQGASLNIAPSVREDSHRLRFERYLALNSSVAKFTGTAADSLMSVAKQR